MSEDVISEEEPEDVYADFIDEDSQRVKEARVPPSLLLIFTHPLTGACVILDCQLTLPGHLGFMIP